MQTYLRPTLTDSTGESSNATATSPAVAILELAPAFWTYPTYRHIYNVLTSVISFVPGLPLQYLTQNQGYGHICQAHEDLFCFQFDNDRALYFTSAGIGSKNRFYGRKSEEYTDNCSKVKIFLKDTGHQHRRDGNLGEGLGGDVDITKGSWILGSLVLTPNPPCEGSIFRFRTHLPSLLLSIRYLPAT